MLVEHVLVACSCEYETACYKDIVMKKYTDPTYDILASVW